MYGVDNIHTEQQPASLAQSLHNVALVGSTAKRFGHRFTR